MGGSNLDNDITERSQTRQCLADVQQRGEFDAEHIARVFHIIGATVQQSVSIS